MNIVAQIFSFYLSRFMFLLRLRLLLHGPPAPAHQPGGEVRAAGGGDGALSLLLLLLVRGE